MPVASLSSALSHGLCLYSFNAQNYSLSKQFSQKYWHRRRGISGYRVERTWKLRCIASCTYPVSRPQSGIISGMTRTESTIANWPRGAEFTHLTLLTVTMISTVFLLEESLLCPLLTYDQLRGPLGSPVSLNLNKSCELYSSSITKCD